MERMDHDNFYTSWSCTARTLWHERPPAPRTDPGEASQTPPGMEYRKKKGVNTELRPSGIRKGIGVKFGHKEPLLIGKMILHELLATTDQLWNL